jgi:hypothetical protein
MDTSLTPGAEGTAGLAPADAARRLLEAYRGGEEPGPYLAALAGYDDADLAPVREDRAAALAFWTNLYNAGTQRLLANRPGLYESPLRFLRFFGTDCLTVAGTGLSLGDIEHGILRGSRSEYGLGYLPRLLSGSFERRYSLAEPDPRVHFALNCGAASCPAIRSFEVDRIDDQLELSAETYLQGEVEYDADADLARVPRLFLWYRGDFGGPAGIRRMLAEYGVVPPEAEPTLRYKSWDWSREQGKFAD